MSETSGVGPAGVGTVQDRAHRLVSMRGRDTAEPHRAATPLELLFDLTFVVAFSVTGNQVAHLVAEGHYTAALGGFGFAMFAITWAWINFSWFASAFDTDDWVYRVTTMVQMAGVIVLALGLPDMFHSVDEGTHLENRVMVAGYVVMRVAMLVQWLRVARQAPAYRTAALIYARTILIAQLGWVILIFVHTGFALTMLLAVVLVAIEITGPVLAERRNPTPWHAHHIVERFGLLTIIALGEQVVGTVASLSSAVEATGWSSDVVVLALAGVLLTFGLWWIYFAMPFAEPLHARRELSFLWGYGHYFVFGAVAGVGAGLHVAGYYLEHTAHIGAVPVLLSVALPVLLFVVCMAVFYRRMLGPLPISVSLPVGGCVVLLALAVLLAGLHVPVTLCLLLVALAPAVIVVAYERRGHQHLERQVAGIEHRG